MTALLVLETFETEDLVKLEAQVPVEAAELP
jgi:hypothetical protein